MGETTSRAQQRTPDDIWQDIDSLRGTSPTVDAMLSEGCLWTDLHNALPPDTPTWVLAAVADAASYRFESALLRQRLMRQHGRPIVTCPGAPTGFVADCGKPGPHPTHRY